MILAYLRSVTKIGPLKPIVYALWLSGAIAGFCAILNYQNISGKEGQTPELWPAATQITPDPHKFNLVMFVHPKCPCSRASLEELNRILARSEEKVTTQIWFLRPSTVPNDWTQTDLLRNSSKVPGVNVHEDLDGTEARRFGGETSGYVVLYNKEGKLLFHGGITGSRGHAGDNPGENAVLAFVTGQESDLNHTHVFGCPMGESCRAPLKPALK